MTPKRMKRTKRTARKPISFRKAVLKISHEMKNVDLVQNLTNVTNTFNLYTLNTISQGTNAGDRTGRDAVIESVQIRGIMSLGSPSTTPEDVLRVMLIWDRETRGAAPAAADVFLSTGGGSTCISQLNYDNAHRFKIVKDELYMINTSAIGQTAATSWAQNTMLVKNNSKTHKIGLKTHYYNTSAGTVADIDSGALYLVVVSLYGTVSWSNSIRVKFRDV